MLCFDALGINAPDFATNGAEELLAPLDEVGAGTLEAEIEHVSGVLFSSHHGHHSQEVGQLHLRSLSKRAGSESYLKFRIWLIGVKFFQVFVVLSEELERLGD